MEPAQNTPRPRILNLSDLIFGLALSISSLTLIGQSPADSVQFLTSLALYSLSFFILINVWRLYSAITSVLPSETSVPTSLNVVLLFLVSIEPYLFAELFTGTGGLPSTVSEVYALDLGFMFLILAVFNNALSSEERNIIAKSLTRKYRSLRNACLLDGSLFLVSAIPSFESVVIFPFTVGGITSHFTLQTTLWVVALVVGWTSRFLPPRLEKN